MSFDPSFSRPRRSATALVLAAALFAPLLAACGKKGDPLPPLRIVPQTTQNLKIQQQGGLLLLEMAYPSTTTSGMLLGGIDSVELLQLVKPAPEIEPEEEAEEGEAEETGPAPLPPVDRNEFTSVAQPLLELRGSELGAATVGDRIQIRIPLPDPLPEERQLYAFGVRTVKGEEVSALSNLALVIPTAPPSPPSGLELGPGAQGIELSWVYEGEAAAFDIYRREAQERGYAAPLRRVTGDYEKYLDRTAEFGKRYIYTVRTLSQAQPPITSADAKEVEVDYEDRYAPPLPRNFVALGERGRVRLRWDPVDVPDLAGYVIYRREPGRDFQRLNQEPMAVEEFISDGLASGLTFDFRIQSVDELGNASELSPPISATVR